MRIVFSVRAVLALAWMQAEGSSPCDFQRITYEPRFLPHVHTNDAKIRARIHADVPHGFGLPPAAAAFHSRSAVRSLMWSSMALSHALYHLPSRRPYGYSPNSALRTCSSSS